MYTRCPYCHTYFKVLAEHLKKAGGQVRCGQCYKVFNSIGNLIEKLPVPLTQKRQKETEYDHQPANDAAHMPIPKPITKPVNEPLHKPIARPLTNNVARRPATNIPDPIPDGPHLRTNKTDKTEFKAKKPQGKTSFESIILSQKDKIYGIHAGPHSPNKDLIVHPTLGINDEDSSFDYFSLKWGLGLLAMLSIFVIQYSYFYRGELAQHASLAPWIISLCDITGCEIPAKHDIRSIKLVRRDITTHPKVNNALLISAALINESKNIQPFPIMRIRLSDTVGQILASRKFNPDEYMDADINLRKGMPPGNPIQINLEIIDPGKTAVNFEFDFFYPSIN